MAKEHINIEIIGMFVLITLPYAINFIWAPIFDTIKLGKFSDLLGHRLSWICLIQIGLAGAIFALSKVSLTEQMFLFASISLVISFLSSAQDTVLGALRTEIIPKESHGAVSGIYIFGYRIGTLISSSGAIYLSAYISFNEIYEIFAILILVFLFILIFSRTLRQAQHDPVIARERSSRKALLGGSDSMSFPRRRKSRKLTVPRAVFYWIPAFAGITSCKPRIFDGGLSHFISSILKPIGSWHLIILVMAFLVLYRLPDNFINSMINPFLIHLNYNDFEIASVGKFFGITIAIIGGLAASLMMQKRSVLESLLIFGILHTLAHSLFIIQELYGKSLYLLFIVMGFESFTGGMAMAAYIAFITSLCQGKFRATQYSFFTSMMGLSRSILPAFSGYIVIECGWNSFFAFSTIAALPSLILIPKLMRALKPKNIKL